MGRLGGPVTPGGPCREGRVEAAVPVGSHQGQMPPGGQVPQPPQGQVPGQVPRNPARNPARKTQQIRPEITLARSNRSGFHDVTRGRTDAGNRNERAFGRYRDDGFTAYVAGRRSHLFRTAYLLCGDPHRAEDIVQTALAKPYVAWPRASRANSVDAYVRRVIINSHLDDAPALAPGVSGRGGPARPRRARRRQPRTMTPSGRRCGHSGRSSGGSRCSGTTGASRWRRPPPTSGSAPAPEEPDLSRARQAPDRPGHRPDRARRTAMTDPADRRLEDRLHALARGVHVPVVPPDDDVRRGRRRGGL